MKTIEPAELSIRPFHLLDREWALLVGGTSPPNPMTVSWGGFGTLWNRPVVHVVVRPTRHTYSRLEQSQAFTLSFLPHRLRKALEICGNSSGRDGDKWSRAGIEQEASEKIAVPRVKGAVLALECRVMATVDLDPEKFLDPAVERHYPLKDYHRVYFGEVLAAWQADDEV